MQAFSGFNGFQQWGSEHDGRVYKFKELSVAGFFVDDSSLISASWSYTAFAAGEQILLSGYLSLKPNSTQKYSASGIIKQICACDRFCLVLLENGKVFKLLPEIGATLQEIHLGVESSAQKRTDIAESFKITHIACGASLAVAISNTNAVYNLPSKIHVFPKRFRAQQLLCGLEHALLLSSNGDVYSWGNGLRGQLGNQVLLLEETPVLVEALAGIRITFIAAGGWHSAAISIFGDLYTWGLNTNGALGLRVFKLTADGLKQPAVYSLPQVIDLPACTCSGPAKEDSAAELPETICAPLQVFAGGRHTIVQMGCGALLAAGWNAHGQLGLDNHEEICDKFQKIHFVKKDAEHLKVICGPWCTILKS